MPKHKKAHVKKASIRNSPEDNEVKFHSAGAKLSADSNATIAALGAGVTTCGDDIHTASVKNKTAHDEAIVATGKLHDANLAGVNAYNAAGANVEEIYPNNPTKWKDLGYDSTEEIISDQTIPEKVMNGHLAQGAFPKQAIVQYDAADRADEYYIDVTKGDPMDDSKYIPVKSPSRSFTKINPAINLPDDYTKVVIWIKVTAHNTAGDGPPSDPFGGKIIQ
ncbi:MAG: hypothetical protein WCH34_06215 [Bacteroidota bacterium]